MRRIESLGIKDYKIIQDSDLYCFTSDAILLSKFALVKKNDVVADLCSGSGIVGIHLYALNPVIASMTLFEMQPELYSMSKESVDLNGLQEIIDVVNTKVQDIENSYNGKFSLITVNPPYSKKENAKQDENYKISVCKNEIELSLEELITKSAKLLKFGGRIAMVHRADRLAEIFYELKSHGLEPKRMQFVSGDNDKQPYLVLVEAVKGGKPSLKVLQTLINKA